MPAMTIDRFMSMVSPEPNSGCWLWDAGCNAGGYGRCYDNRKQWPAHRWIYTKVIGPIPKEFDLDHLCRTPTCVNPAHLEPVTRSENIQRGRTPEVTKARHRAITHCKRGHEFTADNTYWISKPGRYGQQYLCRSCRECRRLHYQRTKTGG